MPFTHTTGVTYRAEGQSVASTTDTITTDTQVGIADTVGANGGVTHFLLGVDVSEVESFCMASDKDVTVFVNVNSNAQQQIDLTAGKMLTWNTNRIDSNPLTVDWTGCYVHNNTTAVATIKFLFAINQPAGS